MKTSYREQPNGYLETIQKGMSAVRYFNRKMSYGKGTREEQILRLQKEIKDADAIVIGAGAGLSTSAGFTYSGERFQKYFFDFEEKYGFHDMYSGGFYVMRLDPEISWAYWAKNIYINRYMKAPKPVYEMLLGAASVFMYFMLAHISRKYESPTVHAELYLWKTDIVGSCGIAVAFLAQHVLGDTVLAAFAPYMDSAVAIVMSVLLLREPISEIVRGFKQMLLFSPPEDVMRRVHEVVNKNLEGLPYRATFIDVIQTGRKTWIEVYLKENLDTSLIDVRHWTKMREYVIEDLKDDFDQIYVEFIPDLSEE